MKASKALQSAYLPLLAIALVGVPLACQCFFGDPLRVNAEDQLGSQKISATKVAGPFVLQEIADEDTGKPVAPDAAPKEADYIPPEVRVPEGFVAELVAAPPLVAHPLMANFDERGRLFIAESAGKNLDRKDLEKELPNFVRMLEDTDGDGKFDKSTIFADKMTMPQGALWYRGALYVCSSGGLWKLEDKDNDGVADKREKIVGGFGYSGNGADVHGPFLSPAGRLVWCDGRHGHEFLDQDGRITSKGKAARIFSCLPDGSDVQIHCGGGMDNPVEVDFTPEGEMLGTVNLFYHQRGDCLVHWVRGGVYPRYDQPDCIAEFPTTGEPLTEVHNYGHVAVSGCMRYRSGAQGFGKDFADHWFVTQFNTHKVVRTVLTRHGGTFRAEVHDFLSSTSGDFHPTDVLEDADGSLLVIDTGGWFLRGCPTSQIAKPNIKGAIWRIRRADVAKVDDPRGLKIEWAKQSEGGLVKLLGDRRVSVRNRVIDELAQRGEPAIVALREMLAQKDASAEVHCNAVWALTRIRSEKATLVIESALFSHGPSVRLAAITAGQFTKVDVLNAMQRVSRPDRPVEIRAAADALGKQAQTAEAATQLCEWLRGGDELDRITEHALIHALIAGDQFDEVHKVFTAETKPAARRGMLLALAQMPSSNLTREDVMPLLASDDFALREAALGLVKNRAKWSAGIGDSLQTWLARPKFSEQDAAAVRGALVAFGAQAEVQAVISESLANGKLSLAARRSVIEAMGQLRGRPWPKEWQAQIEKTLSSEEAELCTAAAAAIVEADEAAFAPQLAKIAADESNQPGQRMLALAGLARFAQPPGDAGFALLLQRLQSDDIPARFQAAQVCGVSHLNAEQLEVLTEHLAKAGPLEVVPLLSAFEQSSEASVGEKLIAGLEASPGLRSVTPQRLAEVLKRYPDSVREAAAALKLETPGDSAEQQARLEALVAQVEGGDAKHGRSVFTSRQAACASCHRVGSDGGSIGPDLSTVAARRQRRDLIEAIAFPSASLARGFESHTLSTKDGKVLTGLVIRQTDGQLHLRTTDQTEARVTTAEVDEMVPSPVSIMPQGLDRVLSSEDFCDLIAYLESLGAP